MKLKFNNFVMPEMFHIQKKNKCFIFRKCP